VEKLSFEAILFTLHQNQKKTGKAFVPYFVQRETERKPEV